MQKKKGISLIVLVITIIVMIILSASVVISLNNTGILDKANQATDSTNEANIEYVETIQGLENKLAEIKGEMVVSDTAKYSGETNKKYIDGDKIAIIPAGFTVSNLPGENKIEEGLVIYSGNHEGEDLTTIQDTVNQYVWIPVENPSDLYGIITEADISLNPDQQLTLGNKYGKLYNFGDATNGFITKSSDATHRNWPSEEGYTYNDKNNSSREPYTITTNDIETNLQTEFDKMVESIEKYNGFYIARYELSKTSKIIKGEEPLNSTSWDTYYNICTSLESDNEVAKEKVVTTMIWGCQFDQALKMAIEDKSDFLTNAGKYGVYGEDWLKVAGTKEDAFNIYDMAGNVWDWTMETMGTSYRARRGTRYYGNVETEPASIRNPGSYGGSSSNGCRAQLYIK